MIELPQWLYKSSGLDAPLLVKTEEEAESAMRQGWKTTEQLFADPAHEQKKLKAKK